MGRYIVKIEGYYLEWSTIIDAPVTFGMPLEEFKEYYRQEYGENGMRDLDIRLTRVERTGTSAHGQRCLDVLRGNRAGPNEKYLSKPEIYRAYCLREPIRGGWVVPTVEVPTTDKTTDTTEGGEHLSKKPSSPSSS